MSNKSSAQTKLDEKASLAGATFTGLINQAKGADIASATTPDLSAADGNLAHVTGTVTTTGFTMNEGQFMELIADAAWPLTFHATTMNINGGVSHTCAPNDRILVYFDGTTTYAAIVQQSGKALAAEDYILIRDEKSSGTQGGTSTSGSWQTRDLNTESHDAGGHASVAANQITLTAGTYRFRGRTPSFFTSGNKCRLQNITDAATIEVGSNGLTAVSTVQADSIVQGRFTIADTKVLELQERVATTRTVNGFGVSIALGVVEVYAEIEFWKEG